MTINHAKSRRRAFFHVTKIHFLVTMNSLLCPFNNENIVNSYTMGWLACRCGLERLLRAVIMSFSVALYERALVSAFDELTDKK